MRGESGEAMRRETQRAGQAHGGRAGMDTSASPMSSVSGVRVPGSARPSSRRGGVAACPRATDLGLPSPQLSLQNSLSSKGLEHSVSFKGAIAAAPWLGKTSGVRRTKPFSPRFTSRGRLKFPSDVPLSRTADTPRPASSFGTAGKTREKWRIWGVTSMNDPGSHKQQKSPHRSWWFHTHRQNS